MTLSELEKNLSKVNEIYFHFDALPKICWSRGRIKKRYRSLRLGSYHFLKNEIRIHPLFREGRFKEAVLHFVIFHELLHYEDFFRNKEKKRRFHDKEFHRREKSFPFYHQATKEIRDFLAFGF